MIQLLLMMVLLHWVKSFWQGDKLSDPGQYQSEGQQSAAPYLGELVWMLLPSVGGLNWMRTNVCMSADQTDFISFQHLFALVSSLLQKWFSDTFNNAQGIKCFDPSCIRNLLTPLNILRPLGCFSRRAPVHPTTLEAKTQSRLGLLTMEKCFHHICNHK